MADTEKTPEEKAEEARLILEAQTETLQKAFEERIATETEAQEADRLRGRERAEEVFPDEVLGRIGEEPGQEILDLVADREQLLAEVGGDRSLEDRRAAELERVQQEFDQRLQARLDPNSAAARAARERAELSIQQQLQGNLRNISGVANRAGTRVQTGLVSDALQGALEARANLERDLLIENASAADRLVGEGAQARGQALSGLEGAVGARREQQDVLSRRLEELQGAIRQDVLNRQQINLENRRSEIFGRLSTEENIVAQGIAARAGTRAQTLSESQLAEQTRHQQEQEEIQRIEAEKPAPSGGGGKSVVCIAHWARGTIDTTTLMADFAYCEKNCSDNVRMGYYWWGTPLAHLIVQPDKYFDLPYKLTYHMTKGWATEMAYRMGKAERGSWIGKAMLWIGKPLTGAIGKVLSWFGREKIETDDSWVFWDFVNEKTDHKDVA